MLTPLQHAALQAAALETTDWIATELKRPNLILELATAATIGSDFDTFWPGVQDRRRYRWDWEHLFGKYVADQDAWMFTVANQRGKRKVAALSWGKIVVEESYVSIEYLERRPDSRQLNGLTTQIAFRFVSLVAIALRIPEVRLNNPAEDLIAYYTAQLGVIRHPDVGEVQYLSKTVP